MLVLAFKTDPFLFILQVNREMLEHSFETNNEELVIPIEGGSIKL